MISEPPPDFPVIYFNGEIFTGTDNKVVVAEGTTASLTCEVSGGFPETTQVSLLCDGVPVSSSEFQFTREQSSKYCVCSGDHVTGCYDKTTSVQVVVLCEFSVCFV